MHDLETNDTAMNPIDDEGAEYDGGRGACDDDYNGVCVSWSVIGKSVPSMKKYSRIPYSNMKTKEKIKIRWKKIHQDELKLSRQQWCNRRWYTSVFPKPIFRIYAYTRKTTYSLWVWYLLFKFQMMWNKKKNCFIKNLNQNKILC